MKNINSKRALYNKIRKIDENVRVYGLRLMIDVAKVFRVISAVLFHVMCTNHTNRDRFSSHYALQLKWTRN